MLVGRLYIKLKTGLLSELFFSALSAAIIFLVIDVIAIRIVLKKKYKLNYQLLHAYELNFHNKDDDILNNGERTVDIDYYLQTVEILGETYRLVQEGSEIP